MKLEAHKRLLRWPVQAMPQILPDVNYASPWFDDFHLLEKDAPLFDYSGHEVWGYSNPYDEAARLFVALDPSGNPVYINEVYTVRVKFANDSVARVRDRRWTQTSVAFSKNADRIKLKGLATKIFWDYLATNGNVAITDSRQTPSGAQFWKKLLAPGVKYLALVVDDSYTTTELNVVGGSPIWQDSRHLQYDMSQYWKLGDEGRLLRIAVTRGSA